MRKPHASSETLTIKAAPRRTKEHYIKHWLVRADLLGRKSNSLSRSTASPAVASDPVQPLLQKPLCVRQHSVLRRLTISHLYKSEPVKTSKSTTTLTSSQAYGPTTSTDGQHLTEYQNNRKMLYHPFSATAVIFF